jgi:hypothetical protein
MLTSLHDDVLADIFSKWLKMVNLVKLDSSMTNSKNRQHFLETLRGPYTFHSELTNYGEVLDWVNLRKIKLDYLKIWNCLIIGKLNNVSLVKTLYFICAKYVDFNIMLKTINSCLNLTTLGVMYDDYDDTWFCDILLKLNESILKKLKIIDFKITPKCLSKICIKLKNLKLINVCDFHTEEDLKVLFEGFKNNHNLTQINFEECDLSPSFLDILFKIRPEILKVTNTGEYLNAQIMSNFANVTNICVHSDVFCTNHWCYENNKENTEDSKLTIQNAPKYGSRILPWNEFCTNIPKTTKSIQFKSTSSYNNNDHYGLKLSDIYSMLRRCKNLSTVDFIDNCPEHDNLEQVEWFCSQLKALKNRCVDVYVSGKETKIRIQQWLVRTEKILLHEQK